MAASAVPVRRETGSRRRRCGRRLGHLGRGPPVHRVPAPAHCTLLPCAVSGAKDGPVNPPRLERPVGRIARGRALPSRIPTSSLDRMMFYVKHRARTRTAFQVRSDQQGWWWVAVTSTERHRPPGAEGELRGETDSKQQWERVSKRGGLRSLTLVGAAPLPSQSGTGLPLQRRVSATGGVRRC